jgi:hypothetical protein
MQGAPLTVDFCRQRGNLTPPAASKAITPQPRDITQQHLLKILHRFSSGVAITFYDIREDNCRITTSSRLLAIRL